MTVQWLNVALDDGSWWYSFEGISYGRLPGDFETSDDALKAAVKT